jgi:hypothetical protein
MLKVVRDERSFVLESDDANAENLALQEAIEMAAPHLTADFESTSPDADGVLRWRVQREDWEALVEVLEALTFEDVNPEEVGEAIALVEAAAKEPV